MGKYILLVLIVCQKSWNLPGFIWKSKFTAKELDEETGLYYYGARYLNPRTSRWISIDPALEDYLPVPPVNDEAKKHNQNLPGMGGVFNPVNLNLYHYAGNNPVRYTDPTGLSDVLAPGLIGAVVGDLLAAAGTALTTVAGVFTAALAFSSIFRGSVLKTPDDSVDDDAAEEEHTVSPDKRKHILDGDKTGGGHRSGTGKAGKSEFPEDWSDNDIIDAIENIANNPTATEPGRGGRSINSGTINGVDIEVITENPGKGGDIVTGYPTNTPRNP